MRELIFVVEEAPEGGYTARALAESIFIEAETLKELRVHACDAVRCHFDDGTTEASIHYINARSERAPR